MVAYVFARSYNLLVSFVYKWFLAMNQWNKTNLPLAMYQICCWLVYLCPNQVDTQVKCVSHSWSKLFFKKPVSNAHYKFQGGKDNSTPPLSLVYVYGDLAPSSLAWWEAGCWLPPFISIHARRWWQKKKQKKSWPLKPAKNCVVLLLWLLSSEGIINLQIVPLTLGSI